jgi:hypothetical protein
LVAILEVAAADAVEQRCGELEERSGITESTQGVTR